MKRKTLRRLEAKRDRAQALLDLVEAAQRLNDRHEAGFEELREAADGVVAAYRRLEAQS